MANYDYDDALEALNFLKKFITYTPEIAIVSGSGLGDIADIIENKIVIDADEIPNWPSSTAPGHAGRVIAGEILGREVIMLQGRVHYYEGYSMKAVTFSTRVLAMLGVSEYIATNASGAINQAYEPGDIIAVRDHINLMGTNPLIGPNDSRWNVRFPDMSRSYDPVMLEKLRVLNLQEGVYAAFTGPSFETPSEVRVARTLGADLAGMSTVPEVIVANAMGLKVCVLSCVANMAAGIAPNSTLTEQEVLDNMKISSRKLATIITSLIRNQE